MTIDGLPARSYPGGGGRIAVYAHQRTPPLVQPIAGVNDTKPLWPVTLQAYGGHIRGSPNPAAEPSGGRAAAGTIFVRVGDGASGLGLGTLIVDNRVGPPANGLKLLAPLATYLSDSVYTFTVGHSTSVSVRAIAAFSRV